MSQVIEAPEPLIRNYQQKILQINGELQSSRSYAEELKMKYELVTEELKKNQKTLNQKSKIISGLTKLNKTVQAGKEHIEEQLRDTELRRKVLYDHHFTKPRYGSNVHFHNNAKLLDRVSNLKSMNYETIIEELQKILNEQNSDIIQLNREVIKANKELLKVTAEYQSKNEILLREKVALVRKMEKYAQIDKKLNEYTRRYRSSQTEEQILNQNKNLKERLSIAVGNLEHYERQIFDLRLQVQNLKLLKSVEPKRKIQQIDSCYSFEDYLNIKAQKEQLQIMNKSLIEEREQLFKFFPQIGEDQKYLKKLMVEAEKSQEYQQKKQQSEQKAQIAINKLQISQENFKDKINELTQKFTQENSKNIEQLKITKQIIKKYSEFISKLEPLYSKHGYPCQEILGFSEIQMQQMKQKTREEFQSIIKQKKQLEIEKTMMKNTIQSQKKQIRVLKERIQKGCEKIKALQEAIDVFVLQRAAKKQSNSEDIIQENVFIMQIQKIQQERNKISQEFQLLQLLHIQVKLENIRLQQRLAHQLNSGSSQIIQKLEEIINSSSFLSPRINIINYSQSVNKFNEEIENLKDEIKNLSNNYDQERESLKSLHENQILKMNEQIEILKRDNEELKRTIEEKLFAGRNEVRMEEEKQENQMMGLENLGSKGLKNKDMSFQEIQDQDPELNEELDIPPNTLTAQSIQELARVLSGHETLLSNVLSSFKQLYRRLIILENQRQQIGKIKETSQSREQTLKQYIEQLETAKSRLAQSDDNLRFLTDQLEQTNQQLQNSKQSQEQQLSIWVDKYKKIQDQYQKLEQQLSQSKERQTFEELNKRFAEEEQVQYLLTLMDTLKNKLREIQQELSKKRQQIIGKPEEKQKQVEMIEEGEEMTKQMKEEQIKYLSLFINSNVNEVLEQAIIALSNNNNEQQQ